jgi:hypothetical protein
MCGRHLGGIFFFFVLHERILQAWEDSHSAKRGTLFPVKTNILFNRRTLTDEQADY